MASACFPLWDAGTVLAYKENIKIAGRYLYPMGGCDIMDLSEDRIWLVLFREFRRFQPSILRKWACILDAVRTRIVVYTESESRSLRKADGKMKTTGVVCIVGDRECCDFEGR